MRRTDDTAVGRGLQRLQFPALREGPTNHFLADLGSEAATRVGQGKHVHRRTRTGSPVQAGHVARPVGVVEDVEQRTVDDGVVPRALRLTEAGRVGDGEVRIDASSRGVLAGLGDGTFGEVDTEYVVTEPGQQHGVFAGTTADVEHLAAQAAGAFQLDDGRLRLADDPRRGAGLVGFVEQGVCGRGVHDSSLKPE
ncbi:hypothetical protein BN975_01407 [Mycolicibacterium farcinogenes]|nr:hypothetical protein BN975_01407 [Mycolicibacterium farcinogenes]